MPTRQNRATAPTSHDLSAYRAALSAGDSRASDALLDRLVEEGASCVALCDDLILPALSELFDTGVAADPAERLRQRAAAAVAAGQLQRLRHGGRPRRQLGCEVLIAPLGEGGTLLGAVASTALAVEGWTALWPGTPVGEDEVLAGADTRELELVVLTVDFEAQIPALRRCTAALAAQGVGLPVLAFGPPHLAQWLDEQRLVGGAVCASTSDLIAVASGFLSERASQPTLDEILASLGARVQAERRRRGWSQAQLALTAGLDRTYVSAVERGRQNLTVGAILKLATALRVPMSQLLGG